MSKIVEKKKDKVSTVIPLKRNKSNENQHIVIEKDYRKTLEEKIQEKKLNRGNKGIEFTGKLKENYDKKRDGWTN